MNSPDPDRYRLRDDIRAVQLELSTLASRIGPLQRGMEQLAILREDAAHAAARIARLERALDVDRVAGHVRRAVNGVALVTEPVPHLVASNVLPSDVYQTLLDAIPAHLFFEGTAAQAQQLRVPPRLAPSYVIVTWMFVNEIVLPALTDVLVARFAEPLATYTRKPFCTAPPFEAHGVGLTPVGARIVRRAAGYGGGTSDLHPWHLITGVLFLARPGGADENVSVLQGVSIRFRANSALAYVAPAEAHTYASIPSDAPDGVERYTYEFGIGLAKQAMARLDRGGREE